LYRLIGISLGSILLGGVDVQAMTVDQLRTAYLEFFEEKGHLRLPSASLVPANDPTLLLTVAGMIPFKPYFVGKEVPPSPRITTCQYCLRTADIENVGMTDRHGTFFEMLGNFSFGDYFKEEAVAWAWEFVTGVLGLDPASLWITIYLDDDEAFEIWNKQIGIPPERIVRLGKEDNFWGIGVGPCGPCSEIHLDRGPSYGCGDANCQPGCDCERFMELWNLVFIQYHQDEQGRLHPLTRTGIDTGMGLERVAAMLQGVQSIFETDIVRPIVDYVAGQAGVTYGADARSDVSLRVIADHMRGVVFMVHDGILPSNERRGYVLRRLLRRAVRHAHLLGIKRPFLTDVADVVAQQMRVGYPGLMDRLEYIKQVIAQEEERFHATLEQGMGILTRLIEEVGSGGVISGRDAFRLHDTYGFPLELTEEIAADQNITVDKAGFEDMMKEQRARARAARTATGYLGDESQGYSDLDLPATPFVGYETHDMTTEIVALVADGEQVGHTSGSGTAGIVLAKTPFYAEAGGQVADAGVIEGPQGKFTVEQVWRLGSGTIVHHGRFEGQIRVGEQVRALVYEDSRLPTQRNHTATHLLHWALRTVLGEHANQAGSLVAPDRLRFDFTHFSALNAETLREIEQRVNALILQNLPVATKIVPYEEAIAQGATALFGEKYGDQVRVVQIGDYSHELCGGTHVRSTGEIGLFRIVSEGSVAAGVRRIEAVTGERALQRVAEESRMLAEIAALLQVGVSDVKAQIEKTMEQVKQLERELETAKSQLVSGRLNDLLTCAERIDGLAVISAEVADMDTEELCALGDALKQRLGPSIVALGSGDGDKAYLVFMATREAVEKGVAVNSLIRQVAPLIKGGGGGSPTMARAGGRDPSGIAEALAQFNAAVSEALG
jgi:alanyl-tRNA synthetase